MTDEDLALAEKHQERMCQLCELYILGCSHNTIHFQCEGSRCSDALDYLVEELEQERLDEGFFPTY